MFGIHLKRFVALTAALIVMLPLSILAARWQWSRHLERQAMNHVIEVNSMRSTALGLAETRGLTDENRYKIVYLKGRFDPASQKFLRKQTLNGVPGFHVLTVFVTSDNRRVLVNRGWVPSEGQQSASSVSIQVPTQELNIRGRLTDLEGSNQPDPIDLPPGQTNSAALFAKTLTYRVVVQLISPEIPHGPTPLPLPAVEAGPHLGYVGQWILIGIASISVYVTVLRSFRREERHTAN